LGFRLGARARRWSRIGLLSAFLGLVLGYATFAFIFPTAAIPIGAEPSLAGIAALLFGSAVMAGLLTDDVYAGTVQGFLALPVGAAVASLMIVSPVLTGMVQAQGDVLVFQGIQFGFPMYVLAIPVNLLGGLVGLGIRDRIAPGPLGFARAPTPPRNHE